MNKKFILSIISKIVMIEGFLLLIPTIVALLYNENKDLKIFLTISIFTILLGFIFSKIKIDNSKFYTKESLVIISFIWIIYSLIGAMPFFLSGAIPNFVDAFFETVSGFTTTGSTILTNIEALSKSMLFWRAFTHWIGGMGVLVFVLAVLPLTDNGAIYLLKAEVPGPTVGKLVPKAKKTAIILYSIYLILTLIEVILLLFGKMSLYDALIHSFSTAGTGGFSNRNLSVAYYNSRYIEYVISVFMILFGINFNIFYYLLIFNFKNILKNEELKFYILIIIFAVITITFNIKHLYSNFESAFRASFFQVSSIITTTGFMTENYNLWPSYSKFLLMLILMMGACAGSTGGGIKVSRILIILKEIKLLIKKLIHPRIVDITTLDGKKIDNNVRNGTMMYVSLYLFILIISIMLLSFDNFDFESTLTSALTTLGNTGPGLGLVGPIENFSKFSNFSKIVFSINMLIGRLEILPMLFLFSPTMWRKN